MTNKGPITELHSEFAHYDGFCLTKSGSLIGACQISGRDPDGLSDADFDGLSKIYRSVLQYLPDSVISTTQYYVHLENETVSLRDRDHETCHHLSKLRERFLNKKEISRSFILHFFEIKPDENLNKLSATSLLKHLVMAVSNTDSREVLKNQLSENSAVIVNAQDLKRQKKELAGVLNDVKSRWDSIFDIKILGIDDLWAFLRFLSNLNPDLLNSAKTELIPDEEWDLLLDEGDTYPVSINNVDMLKMVGIKSVYARLISVLRLGEKQIKNGLFASGKDGILKKRGNYILMSRFCQWGKIRQQMAFWKKRKDLERKNVNIYDLFTGSLEGSTQAEQRQTMKPVISRKMDEIDEAEAIEDKWGDVHVLAMAFDTEPVKLNKTFEGLRRSMQQTGLNIVIESIDIPGAYKTILPAGREHAIRNMTINSSQYAAISFIYRSSEGQRVVKDLSGEECQYILQSSDGTPFHFSPFTGGRGVVIGVGPIRSGKSFLKNTLSTHFMKYGYLRTIDIDPGAETIARLFGDDGAIFRIGNKDNRGFNPLSVAEGVDDLSFISHLKNIILQMIGSNDNERDRNIDRSEQHQLDDAIVQVLRMPPHLRNFYSIVSHCTEAFQSKLSRWHSDGMYAHLFDSDIDAIGNINKRMIAFNLSGIDTDTTLLPLTMNEIFFRTTRLFQDPAFRNIPKYLDIDEAHALLNISYISKYIIRSVRTWGKWMAGIGLWSQHPNEFARIEDWDALKAAASTFFFMADPTLNVQLYKDIFDLSQGEVDAIKELIPKKEAYIIQRDLGVSKRIILDVEPEQHVINTSSPHEVMIREDMIRRYGFKKGLEETIKELKIEEKAA